LVLLEGELDEPLCFFVVPGLLFELSPPDERQQVTPITKMESSEARISAPEDDLFPELADFLHEREISRRKGVEGLESYVKLLELKLGERSGELNLGQRREIFRQSSEQGLGLCIVLGEDGAPNLRQRLFRAPRGRVLFVLAMVRQGACLGDPERRLGPLGTRRVEVLSATAREGRENEEGGMDLPKKEHHL